MNWSDVVAIATRFPAVAEGVSYAEPSLKVGRRLLARYRERDDSLVILGVPAHERDILIEAAPATFFLEPHYEPHDIVLARLTVIGPREVETLLERRWRAVATKTAIRQFDR